MSDKVQEKEASAAVDHKAFIEEILNDYRLACVSREASLLGRKEVLTGKAKFGIFGDGKELAQIALAKHFKHGDFRSGYYRDQTWLMALNLLSVKQFFAGIYAHADVAAEPTSGGRQMGGHFSSPLLNEDGSWRNLTEQYNVSADISPTAGQMPRLLGLAQASKVYRNSVELKDLTQFSKEGNEIAFGSIGDASTSEGLFWETLNAAGVLQVPMVMSVWDDGYGISVSKDKQTTKSSISEALAGFQRTQTKPGFEILKTKGWDYAHLIKTYQRATQIARDEHIPVLVHVEEVTQPQGHSTSGSHERYKNEERLQWEKDFDCVAKFKEWILNFKVNGRPIASEDELNQIGKEAKKQVRKEQKEAWEEFTTPIQGERQEIISLLNNLASSSENSGRISTLAENLKKAIDPYRKENIQAARKALQITRKEKSAEKDAVATWLKAQLKDNGERYSSHLYSESEWSPLNVERVEPIFGEEKVDGRVVLRKNFEALFSWHPEILTFGEDTGKIGGVNQSMEGMQEQFGEIRVSDTGIREATILGQGIGLAMRGLRPIAEIQYLDYLLYALQIMSDDLATVHYRSKGQQKAPVIVRTRGHRLEGIWHSGSPMGAIINSLRGIHVCVPRNMVIAAGLYNTLIKGDDPALVIEPLNGYRTKEQLPTNLGMYTTPLGIPEIVREGSDVTMVSYGSTCNLAEKACQELTELGIDVELIDVVTLLPFDIENKIAESLKKTNRLVIVDEDVDGGATAFIMKKILQDQGGYFSLDSEPLCINAKDHRPAYGTDGDYFSKPSIDDIVEKTYGLFNELNPDEYPAII
ncbi:alpha-ketoacid dehydrogenase subunit alpha/beta [Luteibaculum oceani]|uniref:3-methyl-2-oxobutanoate dehydrogenase (2-methylpropanoyl-transferring) n=1 Tax=Luteibaculum oceani TaxID=1294296 RepID=A0A5C6VD00_9FLAO|nr:alpha-ketoacid dehydrogenase subunit alpha/beta [Luteibaculum oceani]TXC81495.1 transketolase [Luteibaculum oceani]